MIQCLQKSNWLLEEGHDFKVLRYKWCYIPPCENLRVLYKSSATTFKVVSVAFPKFCKPHIQDLPMPLLLADP